MAALPHIYSVYGLRIASDVPLPYPPGAGRPDIRITRGQAEQFSHAASFPNIAWQWHDFFHRSQLPDGAVYVRWSGMYEFLVSGDGACIQWRVFRGCSREVFLAYLLGQALSFALIKKNLEPLHATAVEVGGEAVAFLADSGVGKSSLAVSFVKAGFRLVTDDMLILRKQGRRYLACPGLPRVKLNPDMSGHVFGQRRGGVAMNQFTSKMVIPLARQNFSDQPLPLRALYVLAPARNSQAPKTTRLRALSQHRAFLELIRNTFNPVVGDRDRLERQFRLAAQLVSHLRIRRLAYPRRVEALDEVRAAILKDLQRNQHQ